MKTRTITTDIDESTYHKMKDAVDSEGMKVWRFVDEAIRLRIGVSETRQQQKSRGRVESELFMSPK
ncbi:MAG TPA: hypothetical protein VGP76_02420 [Planctomycetaceae bacterium]|jgi:FAD/FMN-containing dehydrogenase|nr:hypothetical protein [Planctomycetaceae bacterium]